MKALSLIATGLILAALTALAADPAGAVKVKVLKNNVNLRAKPVPTAEVVGQVSANDVLISKSMNNEWVEVMPPTNVDLWILGDYVKKDVVQSRQKVNVRSGPSINFAIVGQLASGERVTPRGKMTEWIKIDPPETCSVWVSRPLVEAIVDKPPKLEPPKLEPAKAEPPKAEPVKAGPPKEETARIEPVKKEPVKVAPMKNHVPEQAVVPVGPRTNQAGALITGEVDNVIGAQAEPAAPVEPPAGLDLIPALSQGQWKQYDGTLRPRNFFCRTPSRYRLVSYDKDGKGTTICFVKGNNDQLSTLINRPMIVSGREYWVQKQTYPVLVPDRIVLK
jgi:SH3-like domain-containing protein